MQQALCGSRVCLHNQRPFPLFSPFLLFRALWPAPCRPENRMKRAQPRFALVGGKHGFSFLPHHARFRRNLMATAKTASRKPAPQADSEALPPAKKTAAAKSAATKSTAAKKTTAKSATPAKAEKTAVKKTATKAATEKTVAKAAAKPAAKAAAKPAPAKKPAAAQPKEAAPAPKAAPKAAAKAAADKPAVRKTASGRSRAAAKASPPVRPAPKTTLAPHAPWPFPTGAKP